MSGTKPWVYILVAESGEVTPGEPQSDASVDAVRRQANLIIDTSGLVVAQFPHSGWRWKWQVLVHQSLIEGGT